MSSFTLWLNLLLHLVVYLLSCFDVLICLILFLFALIKNSFIYSKRRSVIVFWYFAACLSCLCFLPVLRSCFSTFWSYLYLFLTFVVSMYRNLFIFCKSVLYPVLFVCLFVFVVPLMVLVFPFPHSKLVYLVVCFCIQF